MIALTRPSEAEIDQRIRDNARIVARVVKAFIASGYLRTSDMDDAMQEGRRGLWKAAVCWDFERGPWYRYAWWCIRNQITKHFGRERAQASVLAIKSLGWANARRPDRDGPDKQADELDERLERLRVALSKLDDGLAELICARHGVSGYCPQPVTQLAASLGVPAEEVRRRERLAMAQLKRAMGGGG